MSTTGQFEVSLPGGIPALSGTIDADIYEQAGNQPIALIRDDQAWGVRLNWKVTGPLLPLLAGSWNVYVHLESMGAGPEMDLGPLNVAITDVSGVYSCDFQIAAGTVAAANLANPYKPVVTVSYQTTFGIPGPICGFVEFPLINFYHSDF